MTNKCPNMSKPVAFRVSDDLYNKIAASASCSGNSVSSHLRQLVEGRVSRPRPTLAACAALLACCQILRREAAKIADAQMARVIEEETRRVFGILALHGFEGYGDDREQA